MAIESIPAIIEGIERIDWDLEKFFNFFKKLLEQKPEVTPGTESVSLEPVRSEEATVESFVEGQSDVADVETSDQESTSLGESWEDAYLQELSEMSDKQLERESAYLSSSFRSLEQDKADLAREYTRGFIEKEEYESRLSRINNAIQHLVTKKALVALELDSRGLY